MRTVGEGMVISASTDELSVNSVYPYPYTSSSLYAAYNSQKSVTPCGKIASDIPQVNGGHTRPKGPGHPVAGQGVNYLPLGPSGHWSSPGGKTDLSV